MGVKEMKQMQAGKILTNEKGMATLEAIPLLVIFLVFISYGMGLFGVIHTGILYSISARTYAFETFRNRTNLTYFRENPSGGGKPAHYKNMGMRFHVIQSDKATQEEIQATARPISIGRAVASTSSNATDHNMKIFAMQSRNQSVGVSPAWVMVGYGLCLNVTCGDGR